MCLATKSYAIIRTSFHGTHQWKQCDIKEVSFLKNEHHHIFHVEVYIEQFHNNRDVEYIQCVNWLNKQLTKYKKAGNKSCEIMAKEIKLLIEKQYPARNVKVQVSEDGHWGAVVENKIDEVELSWLGGFIDSEGCITICKGVGKTYNFYFSISNSNISMINRCQKIIESHLNIKPNIGIYEDKKYNWKKRYTVQIQSQAKLLAFGRLMYPYIFGKKPQLDIMIKALQMRLESNSSITNDARRFYSESFIKAYEEIRKLNKRGVL